MALAGMTQGVTAATCECAAVTCECAAAAMVVGPLPQPSLSSLSRGSSLISFSNDG